MNKERNYVIEVGYFTWSQSNPEKRTYRTVIMANQSFETAELWLYEKMGIQRFQIIYIARVEPEYALTSKELSKLWGRNSPEYCRSLMRANCQDEKRFYFPPSKA